MPRPPAVRWGVPMGGAAKAELVALARPSACGRRQRRPGLRRSWPQGAMKAADRSGARLALVLGDREIADGAIEVKGPVERRAAQQVLLDVPRRSDQHLG